jgi:hypothetical protein
MNLTEELTNQREASRKFIPAEQMAVMDRATEDLVRSGITESCLKEGDSAPDFTLPNSVGKLVSLDETLKNGPVVLSFYRGGW